MKLILHIGMGKTGSTAIQYALAHNATGLKAQRACYLGMWFDLIDENYRGLQNQNAFYALSEEALRSHAKAFLESLKAQAKARSVETFVMSNEAFSGNRHALMPFLTELEPEVELSLVAYVRNPARWLPSAFAQWGLRDKTSDGPVPPYTDMARQMVRWYQAILSWSDAVDDKLTIRHFDRVGDVVTDFAAVTGLRLTPPDRPIYERLEDSELALRAIFNSRFQEHVLPRVFEEAVLRGTLPAPDLDALVAACFDYSETETIIREQQALFDRFKARFGIDLLEDGFEVPPTPDIDRLRRRIQEHLVEFSLSQARRIQRLEYRLARVEKRVSSEEE